MRFDLPVPGPEEMSRDELLLVVGRQSGQLAEQAEQLAARDRQIAGMAGQLADLMEANEALAARLARLEHLLSRNSGNSSSPPSRDDDPGKPPAPGKPKRGSGPARARGKQPGAPGSHLAWTDDPHERRDRFPTGHCDCGADLADAADLGVIDRYQQHEIPQVAVRITQYDQHEVACCGCGRRHTATRPQGARPGPVGYGPHMAAFAVYLMVMHFVPAHRVVALLESLTGTAPSVGFVHGLLARTAGLLGAVHDRIRTLITLAYAVCCDETPLRVGPRTPKPTVVSRSLILVFERPGVDRRLTTWRSSACRARVGNGAPVAGGVLPETSHHRGSVAVASCHRRVGLCWAGCGEVGSGRRR